MPKEPKWLKEKKKRQLPDYIANPEEFKWYKFCLDNEIRISPIGINDRVGAWKIGISTADDFRKVYYAPHIYDRDTIWPSFYNYCKFYYDKNKI